MTTGRSLSPREAVSGQSKPLAVEAAKNLERRVTKFANQLRQSHADEIARDPKKFKRRAVGFLRRKLPPFVGRPADESITRAATLRAEGREWQAVYPVCIHNHGSLTAAERRQAESNLRAALRSRRNATRRRRRARQFVAELNPAIR
jgi:hypothetical protein